MLLILRIGSLDVTLVELIVGFVYCDNQRILPLCTFLIILDESYYDFLIA